GHEIMHAGTDLCRSYPRMFYPLPSIIHYPMQDVRSGHWLGEPRPDHWSGQVEFFWVARSEILAHIRLVIWLGRVGFEILRVIFRVGSSMLESWVKKNWSTPSLSHARLGPDFF
ncbi:unnamed protein product, partial [Urochloa humidicola]